MGQQVKGDKPRALEGLKVVECSYSIAGHYASRMLADLGAEVIKIEPPEGDETRDLGPFINDVPNREGSGLFLYLNLNKLGVTLDVRKPEGKKLLFELLKDSDVFIEDYTEQEASELGLDYPTLEKLNRNLIDTSITAFGRTGPYRNFKAYDINCCAASALSIATGDPKREPLTLPLSQGAYIGGVAGAAATMTALLARDDVLGEGQHVDVSIVEVLSNTLQGGPVLTMYVYRGVSGIRRGRYGTFFWYPHGTLDCKDGNIVLHAPQIEQWVRLIKAMGEPEWTKLPRYRDRRAMMGEYPEEADALIRPWLMQHTKMELLEIFQKNRIPSAPEFTAKDLVEMPHLHERGFFVEVEHPVVGKMMMPGVACEYSETPATIRTPAPLLGQHNKEVYCKRLGHSPQALAAWRKKGVV